MKKLKFDVNKIRLQGVKTSPNPLTSSDFTFENPLDLFPADIVTIRAIQKALAETPKDQLLVFLAGEIHEKPVHSLSHIAPLLYLKDRKKDFLFAYELPCNVLSGILIDEYDLLYPKDDDRRWALSSDENFLTQYLLAGIGYGEDCTDSVTHLFRTMIATNIPVFFNDAGLKLYDEFVSLRDPLVQKQVDLLQSKRLEFNEDRILFEDRIGDAVRHGVMVERAIAEMSQRRLLYQHCGIAHILGWDYHLETAHNVPYEGSLALRWRDAGAHVVPLLHFSETCIPPERAIDRRAWKDFPHTVIKRNIGEPDISTNNIEALFNNYSGKHSPLDYGRRISISRPNKDKVRKVIRASKNGALRLGFL